MSFEPTRVRLGNGVGIDNYINGNVINVGENRAIATQGPKTATFYNFWRMIDQYQVPSIFMLCKLIEKGQIKCDRYYPENKENNDVLV